MSALGVAARWPLGKLVGLADVPAQEVDDHSVHARTGVLDSSLGLLTQGRRRPGRDGAVLVPVSYHVRDLRIVACHTSSVGHMLVASHTS